VSSRIRMTVLGGLLLTAAARPLSAQPFDEPFFTGIGNLGSGTRTSYAMGISASAAVTTGDSGVPAWYPYEAVYWTPEEGLVSLTPGVYSAGGGGNNGLGTVLEGHFVYTQLTTTEAFRWTKAGGAVAIGDLPGGRFRSNATGVSVRGEIIVGVSGSDNGDWEAFRWTAATGMAGLGDLPGGQFVSSASAISADGLVIVGGSTSENGGEAYRWTAVGGMVGLGDLAGGSHNSSATAVSADGTVVVGNGYDADRQRGFRWTEQTGMVALPKINPDDYSRFYGVSWDGNFAVGTNGYAICWTPEGGTRYLSDVLAEHGVVVPEGWTLNNAQAVSADGRTIVGTGTNHDPVVHTEGFVAYLGPACRADYDESGSVNTADVIAYLGAWSQRSIFADWNYDGYIDTRDVIGFLGEWVAKPGCE